MSIKYKGWEIYKEDDTRNTFWLAISPMYDVDYTGPEDGYKVIKGDGLTSYDSIDDLKRQIDCFEEECNENLVD